MFESGFVWAPERRWADALIDDVAQFPNGESDDWTDTVTQALLWVRNGMYLLKPDDPLPEETREHKEDYPATRKAAYG